MHLEFSTKCDMENITYNGWEKVHENIMCDIWEGKHKSVIF